MVSVSVRRGIDGAGTRGAYVGCVVLCALAAAGVARAQTGAPGALHNFFNAPFFQVSDRVKDCPLPAGPFIDESERLAQTHHRAEKGTTCWLSGACDRPNVYAYDADIAQALQAAWARDPPRVTATLWVTVQGRVVYLEGCADDAAAEPLLEAWARSLPFVQQAIAVLRTEPQARAPYRLR